MVANILPTDTTQPKRWGQKVKLYIFVKEIMLHTKLKGIEHRAPWKQICCIFTHLDPWGGVKRSYYFFFSKSGHVAYQINVEEV